MPFVCVENVSEERYESPLERALPTDPQEKPTRRSLSL